MANEKVSSMTELNEVGSLDNKFLYVVTEDQNGNTNNKMTLRTLQREIAASSGSSGNNGSSGNVLFPQWEALYSLLTASTSYTLPCDCFVTSSSYNFSSGSATPSVKIDGTAIPGIMWLSGGFYCAKGTVIDTNANYRDATNGNMTQVMVVPLLNGDIDTDKCIMLKDQTPQQITEFIQANMGDASSGKYFTSNTSPAPGVYGSTGASGNDSWNLITSETQPSLEFARFAVQGVTNTGIVAVVKSPYSPSNFNKYKSNGSKNFTSKTLTVSSYQQIFAGNASNKVTQSDYNVITLLLYNFNPDSSSN